MGNICTFSDPNDLKNVDTSVLSRLSTTSVSNSSSSSSSSFEEEKLEEQNGIVCVIVGNQYCGKSTFQKRMQMLAEAHSRNYNDIDIFEHFGNTQLEMCRVKTIATILYIVDLMIYEADKHSIINFTKHKRNDADNINSPIQKLQQFFNTFNTARFLNGVLGNSRFTRMCTLKGKLTCNIIDAFIDFFESDDFKIIVNNCQSRLSVLGGAMLIDSLLDPSHLNELFSQTDHYDLNMIDYLCCYNLAPDHQGTTNVTCTFSDNNCNYTCNSNCNDNDNPLDVIAGHQQGDEYE